MLLIFAFMICNIQSLWDTRDRNILSSPPSIDCHDNENIDRMKDRGYFVMKNAIPKHELKEMVNLFHEIEIPTQYLCGASGIQPDECTVAVADKFPFVYRLLSQITRDWISSGFNTEALLGVPLVVRGAEFIKINSWKFPTNSSCAFQRLFDSAVKDCPTENHHGMLMCAIKYIVEMSPDELIRSFTSLDCDDDHQKILSFPMFDYTMGGTLMYDFGEWGKTTSISNLKAWITQKTNMSVYQGFHGWHIDGQSTHGRYHKAFVMVDKDVQYTNESNIRLASTAYTNKFIPPVKDSIDSTGKYLMDITDELFFESVSCDIPMDPGDILFFREDVWHRTQDTLHDRIALIIDIERYETPQRHSHSPHSTILCQNIPIICYECIPFIYCLENLDSKCYSVPSFCQKTCLPYLHCTEPHKEMNQRAEEYKCTRLKETGFCIERNVVSFQSLQEMQRLYDTVKENITKVEGGRVYSPNIELNQTPQFNANLKTHLSTLDDSTLRIVGIQFVAIDPQRAMCPQCAGDWHQDGKSNGNWVHKYFVMIEKTSLSESNLDLRDEKNRETTAYLRNGDVVFFKGDVFHRTQNMKSQRVAALVSVQSI